MKEISVIIPVKEPEPYLDTLISGIHNFIKSPHEILTQNEPGLGNAIACGVEKAKGDIIVIMDADGSHDPKELPNMMTSIIVLGYDIVIGSKNIQGGVNCDSFFRRKISKIYNKLTSFLLRINITDPMSGYIVARKEVFNSYKFPSGYKFMLPLYISNKYKIKEHPIIFSQRKRGRSKTSYVTGFKTLNFISKLFFQKNKKEIIKLLTFPFSCLMSYAVMYMIMYVNIVIFSYLFGASFGTSIMSMFITNSILGWMVAILVTIFVRFRAEVKERIYGKMSEDW